MNKSKIIIVATILAALSVGSFGYTIKTLPKFNPMNPDMTPPFQIADDGILLEPFPNCTVEIIIVPDTDCRESDIENMYKILEKTKFKHNAEKATN